MMICLTFALAASAVWSIIVTVDWRELAIERNTPFCTVHTGRDSHPIPVSYWDELSLSWPESSVSSRLGKSELVAIRPENIPTGEDGQCISFASVIPCQIPTLYIRALCIFAKKNQDRASHLNLFLDKFFSPEQTRTAQAGVFQALSHFYFPALYLFNFFFFFQEQVVHQQGWRRSGPLLPVVLNCCTLPSKFGNWKVRRSCAVARQ